MLILQEYSINLLKVFKIMLPKKLGNLSFIIVSEYYIRRL